ncbi:MAG: hypothetical protein ACK58T_39215, partial [Phycisphaerae bacterium]
FRPLFPWDFRPQDAPLAHARERLVFAVLVSRVRMMPFRPCDLPKTRGQAVWFSPAQDTRSLTLGARQGATLSL